MQELKVQIHKSRLHEMWRENLSLPHCAELPDPGPGCTYHSSSSQDRENCPTALPGPVFAPPGLETKQKSLVCTSWVLQVLHTGKKAISTIPTDSSRAVHSQVSYARQKWKNKYFIVVLSYFIFQSKHLLAPINTLLLNIKIAGVHTGKTIK